MVNLRRFLRSETGFTITELLATILVLTLGVFAIVNMFEMGLKTATGASVRTVATNLANEKIERTRNTAFDSITTDYLRYALRESEPRSGYTFNISYDVQTPTGTGYKEVTITVSWTTPAPASSVQVSTIIARGPTVTGSGSDDTTAPAWNNIDTALTDAIKIGGRTVYLKWATTAAEGHELKDTGQGLAGFYIYRGDLIIAILVPAANTFIDTIPDDPVNFPLGTTYSYRIKAFDAAGNITPFTNSLSFTTTSNLPPTAPTNLIATAKSSSEINLSWTASTDDFKVISYKIYRNGNYIAQVTGTPPYYADTPTQYLDTSLASNTMYTYTVTAVDADGAESSPSNSASETTNP